MSSFEVDESSSFCLAVELTDKDDNPLDDIDSIEWWVGKPKSEEPIIEVQTIEEPFSPSFEIIIPAEANICSGTRDEDRFVIMKVVSGDHVRHKSYEYTVLAKYTVPYPEPEA